MDKQDKPLYDKRKSKRKVLPMSAVAKVNTEENRLNNDKKRDAWKRVIGSLTGEFKRNTHGESLSNIISRKRREER